MVRIFFCCLVLLASCQLEARTYRVGPSQPYKSIQSALKVIDNNDSLIVGPGFYQEGNLNISKAIYFLGEGKPILDGNKKFEVVSIHASHVTMAGFRVQNSGHSTLDDPGGIKVYNCDYVTVLNNDLYDNFFGIYIQYGKHCIVKNNVIVAFGTAEQEIGNGIHCWKSDSLQIIGNQVSGHRDGIYFEFVTHSIIWRNTSFQNIRYGLHFMFSNSDAYITNYFKKNGAGVAVMFTKKVFMANNTFEENWGDASYGLLLKEISDCELIGNRFRYNTSAIFMDGTNRIVARKNVFSNNGWGMKIQANCMDNLIEDNNFIANTFDVSTNGTLVLNVFSENYWDKYQGYDLNKDAVGDLPYRPLSLYSVIVEINAPTILLYRSFIVSLLDKSEKIIPSLTPENFIDLKPRMQSLKL